MRVFGKRVTPSQILISFCVSLIVLFVYLGTIESSVVTIETKNIKPTTSMTVLIDENTTTTEIVVETTTSVVIDTTITPRTPRTTNTVFIPRITTTIPEPVITFDGPPRNITTLVGCIAYYESTWGDADSNVFQFVQGTWEAYGGTGRPENAPYWRQLEVFWLAWEDSGQHHWAAQAGRCF